MATNGTTTHSPLDCDTFNCKQCSEPITSQTGLESFDKQSLPPDHPLG